MRVSVVAISPAGRSHDIFPAPHLCGAALSNWAVCDESESLR